MFREREEDEKVPENRTPEELAELAKEIRRRVEEAVRKSAPSSRGTDGNRGSDDGTARTEKIYREIADAAGRIFGDDQNARASRREPDPRTSDTTPIELQTPAPNAGTVPTGERLPESRTTARDDDFWDLGRPKPRIYAKPDFRDGSLSPADVNAPDPEPAPGEEVVSPSPSEETTVSTEPSATSTASPIVTIPTVTPTPAPVESGLPKLGDREVTSAEMVKKGDILTFGVYEQDGNVDNGREPLK